MPRRKKTTAPEAARPATLSEAEQDLDIAEDFAARQRLNEEGREELAEKLREHHSLSPELSAGDVDAAWELGRMSGEETFTGHAPTPDQDRVDDLGNAAGLTYKDDEALGYDKVARRDERRWELDPRSEVEEGKAVEDDDDEADGPLLFWDLADDLDAEVDDEEEDDDDDEEEEDEEEEDDPLALAEDELEADADEEDEVEGEEDVDSDLDQDDLEDDLDEEDLEELDALDDDDDDDLDDD